MGSGIVSDDPYIAGMNLVPAQKVHGKIIHRMVTIKWRYDNRPIPSCTGVSDSVIRHDSETAGTVAFVQTLGGGG
jgi:hypothetical protein